jgi:hypothetical protein
MTPMVFWASLVPWPSDTAAEEASCPIRNPRSVRSSPVRRNTSLMARMSTAESASPAPTRPPIRAWEEEVGMPSHQVA